MIRLCLYAKNFMKKINNKLFRKVLSKFATGITVVSINNKGNKIGKTVNSFTALSLSPPLVLFSLDKKASFINKFKKSKFFSINILGKKQIDLSNHFSKKDTKWNQVTFESSKFNTPIIKDCLANLECKQISLISQGDHIIFICEVINVSANDKIEPLLYFNSKFI